MIRQWQLAGCNVWQYCQLQYTVDYVVSDSANTDVSNIRKWTNAVDINKEIIFEFFNCW
jgi:hypothetical protein